MAGKEPAESTVQATLDLISLGQDKSGLANLADKVSTMSHTLGCTSKQPSTAVPSKINSRSRGRTPTADVEITSVQADSSIQNDLTNAVNGTSLYTTITNNGNTFLHSIR